MNNTSNTGKPAAPDTRTLLKGNLFIFLATVFFGLNIPAVKLLIPQWMTGADVAVTRILGATPLLWAASLLFKKEKIERGDWKKLVLGGALGLFPFLYLFCVSMRYGSPIDISIIMTLPPIFVIVLSVLFMHNRPSWLEWIGVVVSFAGAVVVITMEHSDVHAKDSMLGDLLAMASALCYAVYLMIIQKPSAKYRPVTLMKWIFLFAAVPCLFFIPELTHAELWRAVDWRPWALIGFIIIFPTFLSYFLVTPAIKIIGSELVSIYQYLIPVVAAVATVAIGLEKLKVVQVVAMLIIVAGMVLTTLGKRKRRLAGK